MGKVYKQKSVFFRNAKRLVSQIKKMEQIGSAEVSNSWAEIEKKISINEISGSISLHWMWWSVAAMLIACFSFWGYSTFQKPDSLMLALATEKLSVDSIDEISLFATTGDTCLKIRNRSEIQYQPDGVLMINNQRISLSSPSKTNQLYVPRGKRVNLTLSDGTKILVNAGSRIVFPRMFQENNREIALEGEAFLDVMHNPKRPFIVKTAKCDVRVLGTAFDVAAYRDAKQASVVLVRGKVLLNDRKQHRALLHPNQMASISSSQLELANVDVAKYIAWKDNLMILDNDKLDDVLRQLAHYYGVKVNFDSNTLDFRMSGKLDLCDSAEEVFEAIQEFAPVRIQRRVDDKYYFVSDSNLID